MDVRINAAMSVDGKLSSRRREQITISGADDFDRVDRLRAAVDGVAVGIGTVVADDPQLTLDDPQRRRQRREDGQSGDPARVVIDSCGRTPPDGRICNDAAATYVLVSTAAPDDRLETLRAAGAEVIVAGDDRVELPVAFNRLAASGIESLLVEGGGELIFSVIEDGLADELTVFVGSMIIGGRDAPTLADGEGFVEEFPELSLQDAQQVDNGVVLSYSIKNNKNNKNK